jgi:hypothetical protein
LFTITETHHLLCIYELYICVVFWWNKSLIILLNTTGWLLSNNFLFILQKCECDSVSSLHIACGLPNSSLFLHKLCSSNSCDISRYFASCQASLHLLLTGKKRIILQTGYIHIWPTVCPDDLSDTDSMFMFSKEIRGLEVEGLWKISIKSLLTQNTYAWNFLNNALYKTTFLLNIW